MAAGAQRPSGQQGKICQFKLVLLGKAHANVIVGKKKKKLVILNTSKPYISVADPGCLSRIRIFFPSRIPDFF